MISALQIGLACLLLIGLLVTWLALAKRRKVAAVIVLAFIALLTFHKPILGLLPVNSIYTGVVNLHISQDSWLELQSKLEDPQTVSTITSRIDGMRFTPEQLIEMHKYHVQPDSTDPNRKHVSIWIDVHNVTRRDIGLLQDYAKQIGQWARQQRPN